MSIGWSLGEREVAARYAFLEPLIAGKRVLEIGAVAATGGWSGRMLMDRGAASAVAADGDEESIEAARASEDLRAEGLEFRPAVLDDLGGGFDLIVVHRAEDLAADADMIDAVRGLLADGGRLVLAVEAGGPTLAAPAGDPSETPVTDDLASLLADRFTVVERASQTALAGYSVNLTEGDLPTALDESWWQGTPAAWDLLLAGPEPTNLEAGALMSFAPAVLEAPADDGADGAETETVAAGDADAEATGEPAPAPPVEPPPAPAAPPRPVEPLAAFAAELDADMQNEKFRELQKKMQVQFDESQKTELAAAQALAERDSLRAKLEAKDAEIQKHKREVKAMAQARDHAQEDVATERKRAVKIDKKLSETKGKLTAAEERIGRLEKDLAQALADLEAARSAAPPDLSRLETERAEVAALRRKLEEERAAVVRDQDYVSAERVAIDRERRELAEERSRVSDVGVVDPTHKPS